MSWDLVAFNRPFVATECLIATWLKRKAKMASAEQTPASLCELMISTMNQHSTDRKDRVYALYGMAGGTKLAADLPVSYSETLAQLSQRVSEYLLDKGHGAWVLNCSGGLGQDRPSWTLDLARMGVVEKNDPLKGLTLAKGTNAMYAAGGAGPVKIHRYQDGAQLKVRGAFVDHIASIPEEFAISLPVEEIAGHGGTGKLSASLVITYYKIVRSLVKWVEFEFGPEAGHEALWRTIIVNFNPHLDDVYREANGRALPGFAQCFEALLNIISSVLDADPPLDLESLTAQHFEQHPTWLESAKFWVALIAPHMNRRIGLTGSRRLALVPLTSQTNDTIAVFQGVPVPFVLRKKEDGYQVVGICYVHGIMNGEGLQRGVLIEDILLY